jgi:hypothetical protein
MALRRLALSVAVQRMMAKSPIDLDMGKALIVLNVPEQVEFWFLDTHDLRDISDI